MEVKYIHELSAVKAQKYCYKFSYRLKSVDILINNHLCAHNRVMDIEELNNQQTLAIWIIHVLPY